jgi:hypothetical protein
MKTIKFILIAIFLIAFSTNVFSQGYMTNLTYNVSLPMGDTKDYISETSFRGFSAEWRSFITKNTSWGIFGGWQVLYERTTDRISLPQTDISGTQDRTINTFPLMLTGHFYIGKSGEFQLTAGMGLGTQYVSQRFAIGLYAFEEDNWRAAVMPDVGVIIPLTEESGISLNARYHWTAKGKSITREDTSLTYLTVAVGVAYFPW